ncbi:MAG TPA: hypothetical protein VF476_15880 [Chitinophagaceae bacterium]
MKSVLIILFLSIYNTCIGQKSKIIGEWQYFGVGDRYCELTVTDSFIYTYTYLRTPNKQKYRIIYDTIFFEKDTPYFSTPEKWIIRGNNDSNYALTIDHFFARLFRKDSNSSTVQTLYDKTKGDYKEETKLFEMDAIRRRDQLEARLKEL